MTTYKLRADIVRDAAKARGDTTIRSIARRTGIHYIDLVSQLNGRRTTGLHSVMRLSAHYGPPVNELVTEVPDEEDETERVAA